MRCTMWVERRQTISEPLAGPSKTSGSRCSMSRQLTSKLNSGSLGLETGSGYATWAQCPEDMRGIAQRMPASFPGPAGVPYSFRAAGPGEALALFEDHLRLASGRHSLPVAVLRSDTIAIPKEGDQARRRAGHSPVARSAPHCTNANFGEVVGGCYRSSCRGICHEWCLCPAKGVCCKPPACRQHLYILEVEGGVIETTQCVDSLPAAILLDFAQGVPPAGCGRIVAIWP